MPDFRQYNLFGTVLTEEAPTSNYRGESPDNTIPLQTVRKRDGREYAMVSAEALRNGMREMMPGMGLPVCRTRLYNQGQLAVKYEGFPSADWADLFFMGFMVADAAQMKANPDKDFRRESLLQVNNAVALSPHLKDQQILQSPKNVDSKSNSALLHREISYTAFQYPFAMALRECYKHPDWTRGLLRILAQLNKVAGGHARAYYEMAPRSMVLRLSRQRAAGYTNYGFDDEGYFEPLDRIGEDDLPGDEFWVSGDIVRSMGAPTKDRLTAQGVRLFANPLRGMEALADHLFGPEEG